jgi:hypothetical protein
MVEGYQSNGQADVYHMSMTVDSDDDYTEITAPFVHKVSGIFK